MDKIDRPEYLHLLVNPENCAIAVCVCRKEDKDAIRICYSSRECEIYSKELMERILALSDKIKEHCTYKLAGQISKNKHMIMFNLEDAVDVDE
ncbi:MAG: hypothetical protein IJ526_12045 [Lachnospiraceae bacterium]|nr:hypothetical protein [Lachnospiraceae bacterium]